MQGELIADDDAVGLRKHDRLCYLLPIRLIATVVFDLDVQVEAAFTSIALVTLRVGARQLPLDLIRTPSIVLLTSGQVPLPRRALQVFVTVIELLQLQDILEQVVSLFRMRADLMQKLLVLEVEAPVALEVVALGLVLGKLERSCLADRL